MKSFERKVIQHNKEQKHIEILRSMGYKYSSLRALRVLENRASRITTAYANGEITEAESDLELAKINNHVHKLFNRKVISGLFINLDPRGYALKIADSESPILFTDWGGYKILAPNLDEF